MKERHAPVVSSGGDGKAIITLAQLGAFTLIFILFYGCDGSLRPSDFNCVSGKQLTFQDLVHDGELCFA
jgi:hypothetical protein